MQLPRDPEDLADWLLKLYEDKDRLLEGMETAQ